MNTILRNTGAVILGAIIGSVVNMAIITISGSIIPPPAGVDVTTTEGLKAGMHLFGPQHFIMPFLAHAVGTFVGALIAAFLGVKHQMKLALGIGVLFLIGGITSIMMLPSPIWFSVIDLGFAYIPVAYLAGTIIVKKH